MTLSLVAVFIPVLFMGGVVGRVFREFAVTITMTILMEMGLIHPPVGLNLFVIQGIAPELKLRNIVWGTMPFIGLMVLGIVLLCFFPEIALWLPNHIYKGR